jgi:tRNA A-37 threonylcarbamoyl transferase component Bud32
MRLIGGGEGANVYQIDAQQVLKIFKSDSKFKHELGMLRKLSRIGVGPAAVLGNKPNSLVMPMYHPISLKDLSSAVFQRALVRQVITMVHHGFLHNDLHVGNIMKTKANTPVIVDFDLMRKVRPPYSKVIRDQLVMAQLYAIIDPANTHNHLSAKWLSHQTEQLVNGPIVDAIYKIRQGK